MDPCAGRTGEGLDAPTFLSLLLLQMRLHVHARLRAAENDQISHRHRMTALVDFILDLDQIWKSSGRSPRRMACPARAKGPDRAPSMRQRSSVAGVPAAVLAGIGGGALVALIVGRAVVIGESARGDARAVIVQVAD